MDPDWLQVSMVQQHLSHQSILPPAGPAAIMAFDTYQELLWTGNQEGRIASLYGAELSKYTSYKAHLEGQHRAARQLLFCDRGVISVGDRSVHLANRRGLTIWHTRCASFDKLRCMSFTNKGTSEIVVAGDQDTMYKISVDTGKITQETSTPVARTGYTIMKRSSQYICAATVGGEIHIIDPNLLSCVKRFPTNNVAINDMDANADFLVTCGWSQSHRQYPMLDPMAAVYDLKSLVPLRPIGFPTGAAFVRLHPKMSTTAIVASQNGQVQVVDIMNPNTYNTIRQINLYDCQLVALEMAPSGEAIAFSDSLYNIHLWASPSKVNFSGYSNATEFPTQVMPPPDMDWALGVPLSTVGMPYYRETLLSAWPTHLVHEVGAPAAPIDPQIVANLKRTDMGAYCPNPQKVRRNQVQDTRSDRTAQDKALAMPKFLSERARDSYNGGTDRKISETMEALRDIDIAAAGLRKEVPWMYRNVEIRYSKFGVDDFDFKYYNQTKFSGLETHIVNSYTNPLLQLYRFTPLLRNLALRHTATSCLRDHCMLCELGFLVDMLEKAEGQNCQATNFLKNFSAQANAAQLGILEEHPTSNPLTAMIQTANRFFLDSFANDYRIISPQSSLLEQAVTTRSAATIRCAHCTHEDHRIDQTSVQELMYPSRPRGASIRGVLQQPSFSQILKSSVERDSHTKGWCDRCQRYQQLVTRKAIQELPPVLFLNAAIHSQDAKQLWTTEGWLPKEIGIIVDQGQFFCYEGDDIKFHLSRKSSFNMAVYELVGVVAEVHSGENQKPHLVSLVNVAPSARDVNEQDEWHLFNDFLVRDTPRNEALRFNATWKMPSVLTFQRKDYSHRIDDTWKQQLDTSILYGQPKAGAAPHIKPLDLQTEAPKPGTPIAIDAEFVSLQREEIDVRADGTRETIRPTRLGLARVSVLRGSGLDEGTTFIDDYIAITDPIVDYLTEFSGIRPDDLIPSRSRHTLCSLKVAYKKLWLLLNLGCVFVGHGLLKDFRTINMQVPKSQVADTVDLFYIRARQRKLNLRFLAWLLLGEEIQREEHDSIEDARTALRLWGKWKEFVDAGIAENRLDWVYARGRECGFRAPGALKGGAAGAESPQRPAAAAVAHAAV